MVNDSVREELTLKVSPRERTARAEAEKAEIISKAEIAKAEIWQKTLPPSMKKPVTMAIELPIAPEPPPSAVAINSPVAAPNPPVQVKSVVSPNPQQQSVLPPPAPAPLPKGSAAAAKQHTSELTAKPTSPTLVEFQNKNAVLPEWRLQLQNSVRRRSSNGGTSQSETPAVATTTNPRQAVLATSGATALKAETVEQPVVAPATTTKNPTLEKALRRIEESRQKFSTEESLPKTSSPFDEFQPQQTQQRAFPYVVPNKPQEIVPKQQPTAVAPPPSYIVKPKPAPVLTEVKAEKFDTNKLPPLPAKVSTSFEKRATEISEPEISEVELKDNKPLQIKAVAQEQEVTVYEEPQDENHFEEEVDDRAPISLRFNAALFDLIIGSFLSVVLLAPFMLSSGNLFSLQGLFAFLATCSIVMFIYLTTTIGTMGRTLGMRLFSLELIDIEENAYPTFHQAAVNSSVYLVSLALGGVGFLTVFLNHEKRAAHDLLSGTIVVREYE